MSFSAVIPTSASRGRRARLLEIIKAICEFELLDEVIVVWQSFEEPGPEFIHPKVRIFLCKVRALSLARNLGASQAKGDWIWFLDDDTMPAAPDYLARAQRVLTENNLDFVNSNVCGEGANQVSRRIEADVVFDERTISGNFWEPGLILRRTVFLANKFDVHLGVGCLHGASEGADLGLRLLRSGHRGMRLRDLELDHPAIEKPADHRNKMFSYALGNGAVSIRHRGWTGYARTAGRAAAKMVLLAVQLRFSEATDYFVRTCGLLVGPLLQPALPVNMEAQLLDSPVLLQEYHPVAA
ncbi:glycosyltransferase family 2 protein [Novosphingobium capsulatum]|uniref:glycosyltransferase family 2 protein n=1 Tax=Novosphingobium capsulatum TaxID=13688 RepID=UPI000787D957|nr:glycosyltransferase family A protein [Novosphingobium capsulatum]WQD93933.1 glycosyltransferase family A protein [Novosphingobium capsulatum]